MRIDFSTIYFRDIPFGGINFSTIEMGLPSKYIAPPSVVVTGITLTDLPIVEYYILGEQLDTTGLLVTATYSDGTTGIVTDYSLSGFDSEEPGIKTVVVSYKGLNQSFQVGVTNVVDADDRIMLDKENRLIIAKYGSN